MSQLTQTAEKAVYDALCNILSEIPPDTSKTRLRASIQDHAFDPELADVIQEYSLLNVKKTAVVLHENSVFSSKAIAQEYFNAAVQDVEDITDTGPDGPASIATETHLSAETSVPLSAQHNLLTKVQAELEAACFEFAKAKLPAVLDTNDWKCAEAAELNLIARALGKHSGHLPGVAELPEGMTAAKLLISMESIRHAAVHREYLKAKDLLVMLRDSESLLILFKDENRLASVRSLREKVNKCVVKLDEDEKNVLVRIAWNQPLHVPTETSLVYPTNPGKLSSKLYVYLAALPMTKPSDFYDF